MRGPRTKREHRRLQAAPTSDEARAGAAGGSERRLGVVEDVGFCRVLGLGVGGVVGRRVISGCGVLVVWAGREEAGAAVRWAGLAAGWVPTMPAGVRDDRWWDGRGWSHIASLAHSGSRSDGPSGPSVIGKILGVSGLHRPSCRCNP